MGVIQNAMNQLLGTASIAARLSPNYETKQELHKLGKQEKALGLQQKSLPTISADEFNEGKTIAAKQHKEILQKQVEVAQRQFELEPTKESMRKVSLARSGAGEGPLFTLPTDRDEIRQEQANIKAAQKSETKQKTKRNFMNYLKNIEVQGGGKVGDLPEPIQKKIAAQYSKEKRKYIMDSMDKEKINGNK